MATKRFAPVGRQTQPLKTRHTVGFPPASPDDDDPPGLMPFPAVLVIVPVDPDDEPELSPATQRLLDGLRAGAQRTAPPVRATSFMLYRFAADGRDVGDTWHESVDDAKAQATWEYGDALEAWRPFPDSAADHISDRAAHALAATRKRAP